MCTLLGAVLPRLHNGILRSKFSGASAVMCALLEKHRSHVSLLSCTFFHQSSSATSLATDGRKGEKQHVMTAMMECLPVPARQVVAFARRCCVQIWE